MECAQCTAILEDKNITETLRHAIEMAEQQFYIICHNIEIKINL